MESGFFKQHYSSENLYPVSFHDVLFGDDRGIEDKIVSISDFCERVLALLVTKGVCTPEECLNVLGVPSYDRDQYFKIGDSRYFIDTQKEKTDKNKQLVFYVVMKETLVRETGYPGAKFESEIYARFNTRKEASDFIDTMKGN